MNRNLNSIEVLSITLNGKSRDRNFSGEIPYCNIAIAHRVS